MIKIKYGYDNDKTAWVNPRYVTAIDMDKGIVYINAGHPYGMHDIRNIDDGEIQKVVDAVSRFNDRKE